MNRWIRKSVLLSGSTLLIVSIGLSGAVSATVPIVNVVVSEDSSGNVANNTSSAPPAISGDGRYVAFDSRATNLVSGDTNGLPDVFVRDTTNDATTRISVSSSGTQSDGVSTDPRISYDGRYVVFDSGADNLVSGVNNGYSHIYIHDTQAGTTSVVDTSSTGLVANSDSQSPDVSADGRYVVFMSWASNLVSGINPSTAGGQQIFIKDMKTGSIQALSINSSNAAGNSTSYLPRIDCGGSVVVFESEASNLVSGQTNSEDIFIDQLGWSGNLLTDITLSANHSSGDYDGTNGNPSISCNGNYVAYSSSATNIVSGVSNSADNVYEYNRLTQANTLVSVSTSGAQATTSSTNVSANMSDDGRYVVFQSDASNLDSLTGNHGSQGPNAYLRDINGQTTQILSRNASYAVGFTNTPNISADGSYVTYITSIGQYSSYGDLVMGVYGNGLVYESETGF